MKTKTKSSCRKILAITIAMMVAFTYSIPINVFANTSINTAEVVKQGDKTYYDKNGNSVASFDNAAVELSKTIKKLSGDNEFEITLNVRTKDEVQTSTKENDAATVLVMDVSNSMVDERDNGKTRLEAAKQAAQSFLQSYVKNAGNAKRMVSVVEFGSSGKTVSTWIDANGKNNTVSNAAKNAVNNVQTGFQQNDTQQRDYIKWRKFLNDWTWQWYWYCDVEECPLYDDWHPESDTRYKNHTHSVDVSYKDKGGTNIEAGMMLARNLMSSGLNNGAIDGIGNTSVVMLTDGVLTYHVNDSNSSTSENTFIMGTSGGGYYATYNDHKDVPRVCSQLKALGSSVYTITYGVNSDTVNGKSVSSWLNNDVAVTSNYSADNTTTLFDAFSKINEKIEETISSSNMVIEDPMGEFITLEDQENLGENATFTGNKLKINLLDGEKKDGITSYTFSYKVKLNTTAQS
ncbi:MAG: VWA domain-containing protein, partial [Aminipila sp.]